MAGGDLANINRWRDQIELAPLTETDVPKAYQTILMDGQKVHVVDFVSEKPLIEGQRKKRLIAAVLPQG